MAGLVDDADVLPITSAASGLAASVGHGGPSVRTLLSLAPDERDAVAARVRVAGERSPLPLASLELEAPVVDPEKIICLGLNYDKHVSEFDFEKPAAPVLFAKFRNALRGAGVPVELPGTSRQVDYEGELALVIGRECRNVSADEALAYVAGVMPFNDLSARDLQFLTSQWLSGKMLDGFAPCGPWVVTLDEVEDLQDLVITTRVNGEVVQRESTEAMIFGIAETVAHVSTLVTLVPGDIIATGTPDGVGAARVPPRFLGPGDTVEVDVAGIGTLANTMIESPSAVSVVSA